MASKTRDYGAGDPSGQPLLEHADGAFFNYHSRPARNVGWAVAWGLLYLAAVAGGVFAFFKRNTHFIDLISPEHLNNPSSCPAPGGPSRRLLGADDDRGEPIQLDAFLRQAGLWLGASLVVALLVGVAFLFLVKHSARALVLSAIGLQVALPVVAGAAMLSAGAWPGAVILWGLAGLLVVTFALWWEQIGLVTRLLGIAGHALIENAGLIGVALGLQFAMVLMGVPLVLGTIAAVMNGNVATSPQRASDAQGACYDAGGDQVMCCTWEVDAWVPAYASLVSLALMWTTFLAFEIKLFTVAGAVAQWYFAPVSSLPAPPGGSRCLTSLRHALGPSFGSLCLGSAILTAVQLARQALEKLKQEADRNIFIYCLFVMLSFLYSLVEFVTKFATVQCAITGQGFMDAGHSVVGLLRRNYMDAFGVWWLPPMVLQSCSFMVSLALCMALSLGSWLAWGGAASGGGPDADKTHAAATQYSVVLGVLVFFASWAVLGFVTSLLLNVVDAVFVCFAKDREARTCTKLEVHQVYCLLPTVGPVVENPDGGYQYAAPQAPYAPPPQAYASQQGRAGV